MSEKRYPRFFKWTGGGKHTGEIICFPGPDIKVRCNTGLTWHLWEMNEVDLWVEVDAASLQSISDPSDKDPHGMYAAEANDGCCTVGNPKRKPDGDYDLELPPGMLLPFIQPDNMPDDEVSIHLLRMANLHHKVLFAVLMEQDEPLKREFIRSMSDKLGIKTVANREPSELATLQIQIRRVVDQCEAVIGEKAHAIPFGMAVSETIAELKKRAAPPVPEGSVEVEVYIGLGNNGRQALGLSAVRDGVTSREQCEQMAFSSNDTHRCIARVAVSPVSPTPTVAGRCV